tara:strand:+ start:1957 stop:2436 length:480 start_codon:yes stop_codon:yes gene_type:complete
MSKTEKAATYADMFASKKLEATISGELRNTTYSSPILDAKKWSEEHLSLLVNSVKPDNWKGTDEEFRTHLILRRIVDDTRNSESAEFKSRWDIEKLTKKALGAKTDDEREEALWAMFRVNESAARAFAETLESIGKVVPEFPEEDEEEEEEESADDDTY